MSNAQKKEWDLSPLLKSESEAQKELAKARIQNENFVKKWKPRSDYLQNPEVLAQALDELENITNYVGYSGSAGYYYYLSFYADQADPKIKAKLNKIEETEKEIANSVKFFTLNIAKIQKNQQEKFLNFSKLKPYQHFLEMLFAQAPHHLSESEEKIITLKQSVSHDFWERMSAGLIAKQERQIKLDGKKQTKNFAQLLSLTENKDKKIRDEAADKVNEIFDQCGDVAEAEINAIITNKKIEDQLRNFPRPDSSRHLEDDIATQTVDTVIKTITENFEIAKKYYQLKAKLLKLPKIKYHERAVPYGKENTKYPFQKATILVRKTFSQLDKQFVDIFDMYLANNRIDVFPKKGKASGAFCFHVLKSQPTYILLNHDDSLKDVTTIAHEVGHGINNELMKEKQNALNFSTPKSTAEVASTFMEDFVLQELLKEASEEQKLVIMMEKLNSDISSIFRQTAFYNFEFELHTKIREKGYLAKEEIGEIFKKHMKSYMGNFVDVEKSNNWWMYVSHFRYMFYVYSYVSGLLISKALQAKVKQNPKSIVQIKEFLSAGTSDSPENIFKKLGIDITKKEFWLSGLKETENLLKEAETLAKKLKKI